MINKIKISLAFLFILGIFFISGCGCKQTVQTYKVNLEVWGFLDEGDTLSGIFENYRKTNPNAGTISYRKLSADTYRKELLEALASGQGPDIFLIHNTWLSSFSNKIIAAPKDVLTEQKFKSDFVDVVNKDFLSDGSVWAAPLSVDSLGLYYNKDLFNAAGITSPPKTWDEFVSDVKKLTKIDATGEITQAGVAMGTAYNVNRSTDILTMLMLQNGTEMINDNGQAVFNISEKGKNALTFYTQFAKASSANYSWNPRMHYSIDAFSEGTAAMMFNYSWQLNTIRSKAPKLNFAVASIPQFSASNPVNYANYWAFAVAKNKVANTTAASNQSMAAISNDVRVKEAWKLITYLTTKPGATTAPTTGSSLGNVVTQGYDPAKTFLESTNQPAARRDLLDAQRTDPDLGPFAEDNLVAKSWKESDPESIEAIFAEMITRVNQGDASVNDAIDNAMARVNKLGQ